jgi:hypothetical protein
MPVCYEGVTWRALAAFQVSTKPPVARTNAAGVPVLHWQREAGRHDASSLT